MKTKADRIKELRTLKSLSQDDLARLAGYSDKSAISKLEHSGDNITQKQIDRIAEALRADAFYLSGANSVSVNISENLKTLINNDGYAASLCFNAGVPDYLLNELLQDKYTTVSLEILSRIARYCEVSVSHLLKHNDPDISEDANIELMAREYDIQLSDESLYNYLSTIGYYCTYRPDIGISVVEVHSAKSKKSFLLTRTSVHLLKSTINSVVESFLRSAEAGDI